MKTPYPQCLPVWSFSGIAHINLPAKKKFYTASGSIFDYFFVSGNDVNDTILPKLHLLEDHAADFMERWSTGHGIYGEQGAEPIHKVFNILKRTYSSIQPASKRLQSMMNEYFRLVHPDAKSLKPEIKRRKLS